jgi:CII-binding regulator of phage lambda lysogenization HflD
MLEKIAQRINTLTTELEHSAAKHNSLVGAMTELKALYQDAVSVAPEVEAIASIVCPGEAAVIDAAIEAVEHIAPEI